MRQPLIDADVISYECGFAAETAWKGREGEGPPPWELVEEMLGMRIANICALVDATEPPIMFLTGKTNFRNNIARRKPYKERAGNKPWHYYNIRAVLKGLYESREVEGLEADDLMAIEQTKRGDETIICTRDKDLFQVPGWIFSWELGNQPQRGPMVIEGYGEIRLSDKRDKIIGHGSSFFLSQCLTGDVVDSVPGLPKCGPVAALKILEATSAYAEGLEAVREAYRGSYGGVLEADEALTEQARLLHMVRELDEQNNPVMWSIENVY